MMVGLGGSGRRANTVLMLVAVEQAVNHRPGSGSGGMKRRAVAKNDEPDREARLRTIAKRGGTSLASSLGLIILFFLLMAGMSFALEIMLHPD